MFTVTVRVRLDAKQMVHAVESVVVEWSHQVCVCTCTYTYTYVQSYAYYLILLSVFGMSTSRCSSTTCKNIIQFCISCTASIWQCDDRSGPTCTYIYLLNKRSKVQRCSQSVLLELFRQPFMKALAINSKLPSHCVLVLTIL